MALRPLRFVYFSSWADGSLIIVIATLLLQAPQHIVRQLACAESCHLPHARVDFYVANDGCHHLQRDER